MIPAAPAGTSPVGPLLKGLLSRRRLTEADVESVLGATLQRILESVDAEAVVYYRLVGGALLIDRVCYAPFLQGSDSESRQRVEALRLRTLPWGQRVAGGAVDACREGLNAAVEAAGEGSALTVSLCVEGRSLGVLQVLNKLLGPFTEADRLLLEEVAGYAEAFMARVLDPAKETDEEVRAEYVARLEGYPKVSAAQLKPEEALLRSVGEGVMRRFRILPLSRKGEASVCVAMANPLDVQGRDCFEAISGLTVEETVVATPKAIASVLDRHFRTRVDVEGAAALVENQFGSAVERIEVEERLTEESAPIVNLTSRIVEDAYARGASDVHVEPGEDEVVVRIRIDGELYRTLRLPVRAGPAVVARIKVMAGLDIAEKRLPQDGRIHFKAYSQSGVDVDLRVSTAPMSHGEKAVMRILDRKSTRLGLDQMGFSEHNLKRYRELIRAPYGMVLHVGPTGSGKTTTLYSALQEINHPSLNIQTAEDPIEYQLKGISQMQMHAKIGLTFASALRCFLRQDPDVILVGEIRDAETAKIAIEASLTGHLLFSTLHTNDAASTVTRFLEIGVEPHLISSSLLVVCAQRLVRRLCPKCKEPYLPDAQDASATGCTGDVTLFRSRGCPSCRDTGFRGRMGVHELLIMNDEVRKLTVERASAEEIKAAAVRAGMVPLYADAMAKVRQGLTSLDEALLTVRKD